MRVGRVLGVLAWGLAALPVLCLAPASLLDLGPDGGVRAQWRTAAKVGPQRYRCKA